LVFKARQKIEKQKLTGLTPASEELAPLNSQKCSVVVRAQFKNARMKIAVRVLMKRPSMKKICIVIGLAICSLNCFSQIIDLKNDKLWIDLGIGSYYAFEESDGFSDYISVNLYKDSVLYKIRFLNYDEFNLFGPSPSEEFYDIGMMIGKGFSGKYAQILFSGGLGVTGGIKRGKLLYTEPSGDFSIDDPRHFDSDRFITPSIPLEIDVLFKPIKYLGAGVSLFGNLNLKQPMYGFAIKFSIGKMR